MADFTSSRPHIVKMQRYQARRAKVLRAFDTALNVTFMAVVAGLLYLVLVGLTV